MLKRHLTPLVQILVRIVHFNIISGKPEKDSSDGATLPRWTQRILVTDLHGEARSRGGEPEAHGHGSGRSESRGRDESEVLTSSEVARDSFVSRRSKTDLTHMSSTGASGAGRSRLPIFVSNENARIWLDLGKQGKKKSNSLDALDNDHHYVNVAPPRPPKFRLEPPRLSTPVYVNVYSLGRRKPGDVIRSGR